MGPHAGPWVKVRAMGLRVGTCAECFWDPGRLSSSQCRTRPVLVHTSSNVHTHTNISTLSHHTHTRVPEGWLKGSIADGKQIILSSMQARAAHTHTCRHQPRHTNGVQVVVPFHVCVCTPLRAQTWTQTCPARWQAGYSLTTSQPGSLMPAKCASATHGMAGCVAAQALHVLLC